MSSKRYHRSSSSECEDEPLSKIQRIDDYEDDSPNIIVKHMITQGLTTILHRTRGKELTAQDEDEIERMAYIGFPTDAEFEEQTKDLTKQEKTEEFVQRGIQYMKRRLFVSSKWEELVKNDNQLGNIHIKKDPYKNTQIDDFFSHDDQIYDEKNYEHNRNIQLKEDRPHSSNSAGELIVTEGDDAQADAESAGFKGSVVFGFKGLPNKLQKEKIRVKTRQQRNGFDKPDPSMVTAKDLQMKHPDMGRCKICYWCTKGYLARSMYSLEKKKFEGEDFKDILSEDPHKAAMIAGSNFKMKYYEMRDVFSPEESCATLARIWNARIQYMRHKYSEKMTQTQMEESIDDFFGMIDKQIGSSTHDRSIYEFSGSKAKTIEDYEYERSLDAIEEEEADDRYSFMPPEVDVDDFRHHFKNCLKSDVENILLEKLVEVNNHLSIIGDNLVFTKTMAGPLDEKASEEDKPSTQKVGQLNHINCHMYYQGIDRLVKLASEHRQTQRENKHSGMLYQNLGLFKDTVPNLTGIDSLRAIKYKGSNKGRSFKKGQYRGGETSGV